MGKEYASQRDLIIVMLVVVLLSICTVISVYMVCDLLIQIQNEMYSRTICIPQIKESGHGDIYTMTCMTEEQYNIIYTEIIQKPTDKI